MTTKIYKVGQTKKGARVWLEGNILKEHGFKHGTVYHAEYIGNEAIVIQPDIDGKKKVAGSIDRPIIDLLNKKIGTMFKDKVQVAFMGFTIIITQGANRDKTI